MKEAGRRWDDFQKVQCPEPSAEELKEATERIEAGENPRQVLEDFKDRTSGEEMAYALRLLKAGLGLTTDAQRAFWEVMEDQRPTPWISVEDALDQAALMGLILGLAANELAVEEEGKQASS